MRTFLQFWRSLFFTFSFFLWSFVYEIKKQQKINFSEPLDRPCTIKEPLGDRWYLVLRNKKVFGRGGCLHPAPVISAFPFSFYFWNFFYENKLREINFSESLDMPRYIIVSPGVLQNIKVVPSSSSCDFCFLLFRFSFGVSSTRTKSSESSISQNRLICHHYKVSVPWFYKTNKIL